MKNRIIILFILLIIVFGALFFYLYYKKSTRNAVEILAENGRMINVLIAGSNTFRNNRYRFFAIFSYNTENGKTGITMIPPELIIDLDGNGKNFSKIEDIDLKYFKELSGALQQMLKLYIPFYVILYSPDTERIADLIEGIDLFILDELNIQGIKFGLNYFDGNKINQYINSVEENSIYKKYDRIQDILLTLFFNKEKFKKFMNLELISEVLKTVKTNMLAREIMSLARLLYEKESGIYSIVLPGYLNDKGYFVSDETSNKIYKTDYLSKLILEDNAKTQIKIKILNGTDIPGLAKRTRNKLVTEGYSVSEFGTSPYPPMEKSLIINRKGESVPARKVAEFLDIDSIYHSVDSSVLHDLVLIIGADMGKK